MSWSSQFCGGVVHLRLSPVKLWPGRLKHAQMRTRAHASTPALRGRFHQLPNAHTDPRVGSRLQKLPLLHVCSGRDPCDPHFLWLLWTMLPNQGVWNELRLCFPCHVLCIVCCFAHILFGIYSFSDWISTILQPNDWRLRWHLQGPVSTLTGSDFLGLH
jgi:hypothetical protein